MTDLATRITDTFRAACPDMDGVTDPEAMLGIMLLRLNGRNADVAAARGRALEEAASVLERRAAEHDSAITSAQAGQRALANRTDAAARTQRVAYAEREGEARAERATDLDRADAIRELAAQTQTARRLE